MGKRYLFLPVHARRQKEDAVCRHLLFYQGGCKRHRPPVSPYCFLFLEGGKRNRREYSEQWIDPWKHFEAIRKREVDCQRKSNDVLLIEWVDIIVDKSISGISPIRDLGHCAAQSWIAAEKIEKEFKDTWKFTHTNASPKQRDMLASPGDSRYKYMNGMKSGFAQVPTLTAPVAWPPTSSSMRALTDSQSINSFRKSDSCADLESVIDRCMNE